MTTASRYVLSILVLLIILTLSISCAPSIPIQCSGYSGLEKVWADDNMVIFEETAIQHRTGHYSLFAKYPNKQFENGYELFRLKRSDNYTELRELVDLIYNDIPIGDNLTLKDQLMIREASENLNKLMRNFD